MEKTSVFLVRHPSKVGLVKRAIFTFLDFFQRLFAVRATKDHLLGEPISVVEPALAHFAWFLPFSTIDGVQVGGGSLAAMADQ
ncbi:MULTISPECIES: hypothetical protein [Geobacillus]|uniref:Uncharacterized protein n=1 Tax=Geobacillus thermodenitrificans TaxID=33940 RepID=A0ABY9Q9B4_GEOTD|nr:hypothetical protein [Geobacillus thermodenitrificans]WMV74702.1 hypothetical protein HSX42_10300 [Geobacillus thermodenitrificans]